MLRGLPAEHFDAHTVRIEREERVVVALQVAILLGRKVNPSAASETPHVRVIDLAPMIHLEGEMFDADVVVAMSTAVGRPEPEHRARSRVLEVHHLLGSTVAWVADALGPPELPEQIEVERERAFDVGDRKIDVVYPSRGRGSLLGVACAARLHP